MSPDQEFHLIDLQRAAAIAGLATDDLRRAAKAAGVGISSIKGAAMIDEADIPRIKQQLEAEAYQRRRQLLRSCSR